ncbi:Protein of unknown function, partial [Gryllus bimaculatus]
MKVNEVMSELTNEPRRRSGGIVVVDAEPVKQPLAALSPAEAQAHAMMLAALHEQPHREMAVDVPDSFVARSKTPPRYPPPRPLQQQQPPPALPPGAAPAQPQPSARLAPTQQVSPTYANLSPAPPPPPSSSSSSSSPSSPVSNGSAGGA